MAKELHEMSDEEILAADPMSFVADTETTSEEEIPESVGENEPVVTEAEDTESDGDEPAEAEGQQAGDEDGAVIEDTKEDAVVAAATADTGDDVATEGSETPVIEGDGVDYKAEYERILAPFKANGKDMHVDSIEDAITLMQMGANYNKKMAGLKPNLRLLKMLEKNGVLNEERLSYLIDLEKRKPEAIKQLLKDSGIDPLDLQQEEGSEYRPTSYTVEDREMELEAVLDTIQDTPTFRQTIEVVTKKWDGPSKQTIADTPQLLEVINDHMARGVFDVISTEVERERMLGRLRGLSDLAAYHHVGNRLQESGGFDHLSAGSESTPRREVQPKATTPDPIRDDKRRAAGSTRTEIPIVKPKEDFNPLAMSDEDFDKQIKTRLL